MSSSHTLYLCSANYERLNLISRKLHLSKSTIINQFCNKFLALDKDTRNKILSDSSYGYFKSYSVKVRTTWVINGSFYKGIDKIAKKYNLSISEFIHRVLHKYSWLFLERYELSLLKVFNKVHECNPKRLAYLNRYEYIKG